MIFMFVCEWNKKQRAKPWMKWWIFMPFVALANWINIPSRAHSAENVYFAHWFCEWIKCKSTRILEFFYEWKWMKLNWHVCGCVLLAWFREVSRNVFLSCPFIDSEKQKLLSTSYLDDRQLITYFLFLSTVAANCKNGILIWIQYIKLGE